jgi:hypothetical protein
MRPGGHAGGAGDGAAGVARRIESAPFADAAQAIFGGAWGGEGDPYAVACADCPCRHWCSTRSSPPR